MTDHPILEVENLCTTFSRGGTDLPAVRDVSFALGKGQVQGLVGESGSGKSVTLRSILGLARHYGEVRGSVRWQGQSGDRGHLPEVPLPHFLPVPPVWPTEVWVGSSAGRHAVRVFSEIVNETDVRGSACGQ